MQPAFLCSADHGLISLLVERSGDRLFVECRETIALFKHLTISKPTSADNTNLPMTSPPLREPTSEEEESFESAYLKGVIIPREGAFFDLMDSWGVVAADVIRLSHDEAARLIIEKIHWEASYQ